MATVDPRTWAAPGPTGIRRYVPILTWLPAYDRSFLRFDTIAGEPLPRAVIIDAAVNDTLDITSAEMLIGVTKDLRAAGIDFALAEVRRPATSTAHRSRLLEVLGEDRVFDTVGEAVTGMEKPAAAAAHDR